MWKLIFVDTEFFQIRFSTYLFKSYLQGPSNFW